jgi:hypothetical protein
VLLAFTNRRGHELHWRLVKLLLAWAIATGLLFGALVADLQLWHMVPPAVALFLTMAILAPIAARRLAVLVPRVGDAPRLVGAAGVAVYVVCLSVATLGLHPTPYPWQADVYRSLPRFDAHLGPGDRLGSFNAGIPGYFSRRQVVNLDGVVNHSVVSHWQAGTWSEFVHSARVTHIADDRASLQRALSFASWVPVLTQVDEFPLRLWPGGPRVLWRVGPPTTGDAVPSAPHALARERSR